MAQIWEYIKIALMNIKSNKGRSVLTMLGIIIGIASVIMVMAIGNGVRGQINDELESMGSGLIELMLDTTLDDVTMRFSPDDFDLIQTRVEHVKGVTPLIGGWGQANGAKGNYEAQALGGTEALQYYSGNGGPIVKGRYFTKEDVEGSKRVCVISESNAISLFGTTDVVGMGFELSIYGISNDVTIVGIREDSAGTLVNTSMSTRITVEMPYTSMADAYYYYVEEFSDLLVFAEASEYCTEVAQKAIALLENKYDVRGEGQIMVQSISDMSAQFDSILGILTLFISFVAAISLLVGGIGVMNIMLVSVTERTREIGIRKSLGARTGSILLQFLSESAIITLLGGIIGIILGTAGAIVVGGFIGFAARVKVGTVLTASIFSAGVGIFFGIYPARKAAKLSPIEALRHE